MNSTAASIVELKKFDQKTTTAIAIKTIDYNRFTLFGPFRQSGAWSPFFARILPEEGVWDALIKVMKQALDMG